MVKVMLVSVEPVIEETIIMSLAANTCPQNAGASHFDKLNCMMTDLG